MYVNDIDAYLVVIVSGGGRQVTTCGGRVDAVTGTEEPKSNFSGRSFSSSQTFPTDFPLRVLIATDDAEGQSISHFTSVQISRVSRNSDAPHTELNRVTRGLS